MSLAMQAPWCGVPRVTNRRSGAGWCGMASSARTTSPPRECPTKDTGSPFEVVDTKSASRSATSSSLSFRDGYSKV